MDCRGGCWRRTDPDARPAWGCGCHASVPLSYPVGDGPRGGTARRAPHSGCRSRPGPERRRGEGEAARPHHRQAEAPPGQAHVCRCGRAAGAGAATRRHRRGRRGGAGRRGRAADPRGESRARPARLTGDELRRHERLEPQRHHRRRRPRPLRAGHQLQLPGLRQDGHQPRGTHGPRAAVERQRRHDGRLRAECRRPRGSVRQPCRPVDDRPVQPFRAVREHHVPGRLGHGRPAAEPGLLRLHLRHGQLPRLPQDRRVVRRLLLQRQRVWERHGRRVRSGEHAERRARRGGAVHRVPDLPATASTC